MSDNVMSRGMMAPLKNPILDREEREEFDELLYDKQTGLHLNYEGTLIYSDDRGSADDAYGIIFEVNDSRGEFLASLQEEGIEIDETKMLPYQCYWYNGSDPDMGLLKLKDYLKNFK